MPTQICRAVVLCILTFMISQATITWALTDTIAPQTLFYSQDDHTLTVNLDNLSLHEALQNLANQLAVRITLKGVTGQKRLSTRFTRLPVEQGIEQLLQGQDYAILYSRAPSSQKTLPREIIVLPRTTFSENPESSETTIMVSPSVTQENTVLRHQDADQNNHKQTLTRLAHTIETLVQQFDQTQPQNNSATAQARQVQDSEIQTMVDTLLQQSESISQDSSNKRFY